MSSGRLAYIKTELQNNLINAPIPSKDLFFNYYFLSHNNHVTAFHTYEQFNEKQSLINRHSTNLLSWHSTTYFHLQKADKGWQVFIHLCLLEHYSPVSIQGLNRLISTLYQSTWQSFCVNQYCSVANLKLETLWLLATKPLWKTVILNMPWLIKEHVCVLP